MRRRFKNALSFVTENVISPVHKMETLRTLMKIEKRLLRNGYYVFHRAVAKGTHLGL